MTEDEMILSKYEIELKSAMRRVTELEEAIAQHKKMMAKKAAQPSVQADDVYSRAIGGA